MSKNIVVIGAQWGDEGTGKIVDILTEQIDIAVIFQGNYNDGRTIVIDGEKYALHTLPSGILREHVTCIIGNGVVLSMNKILKELDNLHNLNIPRVYERVKISETVPLILESHILLDIARANARIKKGMPKSGITKQGIGPAYEDKIARRAVRAYHIRNPYAFETQIKDLVSYHNQQLELLDAPTVDVNTILEKSLIDGARLLPMICDTSGYLNDAMRNGKTIIFEGSNGALLDIDNGTYPYITNSNCVASTAATGSGVGAKALHNVLGVIKAYSTRLNSGAFPTWLTLNEVNSPGWAMSNVGEERETTGAVRRCGWLDIPVLRRSIELNGIDSLCLSKIDVLDSLDEIKICTSYTLDGVLTERYPIDQDEAGRVVPIYETFKGWKSRTAGAMSWDSLPEQAKAYILRIESLTKCPISMVSTGPDRENIIER